jgi:murein DD-endopeptidase MepM/ murein hydrolase activator NlpD
MVAVGEVVRGWTHGTFYPNRPRKGVVVHNTQGFTPLTTYESGGGWNRLIGRNGTIYRDVPDTHAAWHVEATGHTPAAIANTRWRPSWLVAAPGQGVSDANYSTLGVELEGFDQTYTEWQYGALRRVLWDWTKGVLPVITHQQLQKDRTDPVRFDYKAVFGIPYAEATEFLLPLRDPLLNGALWPLRGVDWRNPLGASAADRTDGGYNFLDWTDSGHTPHPGIDLNVGSGCADDAGLPIVAPAAGTVLWEGFDDATARSVGWSLWLQTAPAEFHHLCHMQERPLVRAGEKVNAGVTIGHCGKTKGWDCEHVHWEIRRTRPPGDAWTFWPYNWSQQQVADAYIDPLTWIVVRGAALPPPPDEPGGGEDVGIIDELNKQVADLKAEVAGLNGLARERDQQIAALKAEIGGLNSTVGALRHDVIAPLQAEVAALKLEVAALMKLVAAAGDKPHILSGSLTFSDGTTLDLVPKGA